VVDGVDRALLDAGWKEDHVPNVAVWDIGRGIFVGQMTNDGGAEALIRALQLVNLPVTPHPPVSATAQSKVVYVVVQDKP